MLISSFLYFGCDVTQILLFSLLLSPFQIFALCYLVFIRFLHYCPLSIIRQSKVVHSAAYNCVMKALADPQVTGKEHRRQQQNLGKTGRGHCPTEPQPKETSLGKFPNFAAAQGHRRASTSLDAERRQRRGNRHIRLATPYGSTAEWCA